MRNLPLLAALLLVTCVRSTLSPSAPREYDESIRFPEALDSVGMLVNRPDRYDLDGAAVQAIMIAAHDFISVESKGLSCWNKPGDFVYRVIRQENILFVRISADPYACHGIGAMDFGARYAISTEGRILRRLATQEPDWASPASIPDAGLNEDAGNGRPHELRDLVPMISGPVDDPPFFTRPEWQADNPWPSSRKPPPCLSPDGGTLDAGTPDGGFHADGG